MVLILFAICEILTAIFFASAGAFLMHRALYQRYAGMQNTAQAAIEARDNALEIARKQARNELDGYAKEIEEKGKGILELLSEAKNKERYAENLILGKIPSAGICQCKHPKSMHYSGVAVCHDRKSSGWNDTTPCKCQHYVPATMSRKQAKEILK